MDQEMSQGQSVDYNRAEQGLEVTIGDPSAVEVFVNGEQRDISDESADYSFTIDG